jgi:GTPase SAR1 family protein
VIVDSKPCFLQFLDTDDGTVEVEEMRHYMRYSDGALVVYDTCSRNSFTYTRSINTKYLKPDILRGAFAVLLVGNQNDRADKREVGFVEGLEYAQSIGAGFSECSATTNEGTEQVLEELVRQIRWVKEVKEELEKWKRLREEQKKGWRKKVKRIVEDFYTGHGGYRKLVQRIMVKLSLVAKEVTRLGNTKI